MLRNNQTKELKSHVDLYKTDIYSLGITLYQTASGLSI